jgi:PAS domain S-box-containing protein
MRRNEARERRADRGVTVITRITSNAGRSRLTISNAVAPHPRQDFWHVQAAVPDTPDDRDVSDAEFRLLAENLPTLCWMARADGHIFWYNRRWYNYSGTTPAEMEGWGWQSIHNPDALPGVMANWQASIASGEPFEMVFPLRGADGVYRRFLTRIVPIRDPSGQVVRWFGTNTEIESQISAEEALAASEAKFGVLTDAMPQMVWSTLPDGFHDYYNAQWYEFTGVPFGSTDGEGWNGMFHPDDQERAWARWRQSLVSGDPYEIEYRLRHRSGEYRWVLGRALPVRDASGAIIRWIGTCTEVHQAKKDAERTELLGRELSHRIKNIFAVIGGLIGLSIHRAPEAKEFAQQLSSRIAALGRAHNYARPHSDLSRPVRSEGGLHGLLGELLDPYDVGGSRILISGKDSEVDDRAATPVALVVHELATNAAKYGSLSAPGGSVSLTTERLDDIVEILWQERGGPPVSGPPARTGFGSQLSALTVEDQLGGTIEHDWIAEGLSVTIRVKADRLCGASA